MTARLKESLLEEIEENITKVFLWTDLKTVLNILRNLLHHIMYQLTRILQISLQDIRDFAVDK